MKHNKTKHMRTLLWAVAVTAAAPLVFGMVQTQDLGDAMESASADSVSADDGVIYRDQLPGTYPLGTIKPDTTSRIEDMYVYIKAVARAYGDSVVLRWAISEYPEWEYLNHFGYDVYRVNDDADGFKLDTLAQRIRPLSLEQFKKCYPDTLDSIAYMGMGAIYGSGDMSPEMTTYEPGTIGAFSEM